MTHPTGAREALRPCPFCGDTAAMDAEHGRWYVECTQCSAVGMRCTTAEKAAEFWNRRPESIGSGAQAGPQAGAPAPYLRAYPVNGAAPSAPSRKGAGREQ